MDFIQDRLATLHTLDQMSQYLKVKAYLGHNAVAYQMWNAVYGPPQCLDETDVGIHRPEEWATASDGPSNRPARYPVDDVQFPAARRYGSFLSRDVFFSTTTGMAPVLMSTRQRHIGDRL